MEFAKKFLLIPEAKYVRHIVPDESLSDLDKEIKKILHSRQTDAQKIRPYNEVLKKRIDLPLFNPPKKETPVEVPFHLENQTSEKIKTSERGERTAEITPRKDFIQDLIMQTVPKRMKCYAETVLQVLKENSDIISWTANGVLK